MALKTYQDLIVWQSSRQLVKEVYEICSKLPKEEVFGICSQMKRSAVSIPSNIAEGYRRNNTTEYVHFLGIAAGSAAELETQLIITNDLFNLDIQKQLDEIDQIQRMLLTMITKLKKK